MASVVWRNKDIHSGALIIKGTRLPVSLILELIADGYHISDISKIYPYLTKDTIKEVLAYSARKINSCR